METKSSNSNNTGDNKENKDKKDNKHPNERWKNPEDNKMGNDITGDMKIANSNGELEGGRDKRWHLEDDDQD